MEYEEQDTSFSSIKQKVVFIGNSTTGKTSLLNRIYSDKFQTDNEPTIGVDFFTKTVLYNEKIFKVQLWDTSGQEKYRSLIPSYIRGASIIFIIYDLNNYDSFDSIISWLDFAYQNTDIEKAKLILVGNKKDLERKVSYDEGKNFAKEKGLLFFETSAKTGEGVKDMFYSSFAAIDFFNDIRNEKNNELITDLIEQNNNTNKKPIIPSVNDILTRRILIKKNNINNSIDIETKDNLIIENNKNRKKRCGC